jgi:hypothetical protein
MGHPSFGGDGKEKKMDLGRGFAPSCLSHVR